MELPDHKMSELEQLKYRLELFKDMRFFKRWDDIGNVFITTFQHEQLTLNIEACIALVDSLLKKDLPSPEKGPSQEG